MVETGRLLFVRTQQKKMRAEMYSGLAEAVLRGDTDGSMHGKRIILPSSFIGGARYMIQNYQDAMAICRWVGYPSLFITFTCNPKWPEIVRFLSSRGLKSDDRPDIVCRIFKVKLDSFVRDLKTKNFFGAVKAVVYTIEFQKRGLPHSHILLFLSNEDKQPRPQRIDEIISAEIPDPVSDPGYFKNVQEYMVHGPCGVVRKSSPCMRNGRCSKYFPKKFVVATTFDDDGYPVYRRRDSGRVIMKDGVPLDNRYIVLHNRALLMKYGGHVNVEWCNQSRSIKYLFKYINKGHDRVTTSFFQSGPNGSDQVQDEISLYYDCRYISSCEAAWRILGFEVQYKDPSVERLSFHLPNEQSVIFDERDRLDNIIWQPRKQRFSIGRLFYVPPGSGDIYYLRCLLNIVRGATSYEDIRRVNGVQYDTFRDACFAFGLLDDDKEYVDGIIEASFWSSAHSIRLLFVSLLTSDSISRPDFVWRSCWKYLSEDVLYNQRKLRSLPGLLLSDEDVQNFALAEIEKLLLNIGKSLQNFQGMPYPKSEFFETFENRLICDELCYDRETLGREHLDFLSKFTDEQLHVHNTIMSSVDSNAGGMFFVYGYGGTGKTFIWKSLSAGIRSKGEIVLNVASSDIASLLLPGGRTTHSRFKIPIIVDEDSMCNIKPGSALAELIIRAKLIIWDEAPMVHKHSIEAVGRTFRDIMRVCDEGSMQKPFGGKTVVFGGDFRQILPVVPKGSRQDVVNVVINSSYLWKYCRIDMSSDSIAHSDSTSGGLAALHSVEFLNNLKCSGTPNHELLLKVGTPVMLLRNIDHSNGLCNGTRLLITRLGDYVLEAQVLAGHNVGHKVLIPRMSLIPSDPRLPFKLQRRQFPVAVSYAMTINKSQGQSLAHVGLFLRKPVFSHGQLYVAISRVTSRAGMKILVCKDEDDDNRGDSTVNVVYKEVFQNL
ncbi:uncharacterized protein LOC125195385 [Salvia hispanica]|uniref:uncharacterized protein LOC125195385 n=1 Tax=Salvia hispanica TaxID=49212 RepID=UPI0020093D23|nr:uncharacterized protein LOC125195385 [Salvia hispanica]